MLRTLIVAMVEPNRFMMLPCELICSVLVGWLEINEVAMVDSAFCNHSQREILVETVYPLCILRVEPTTEKESVAMMWLIKRNLKANYLKVDQNSYGQLLEAPRKFVTHVKSRGLDNSHVTALFQIFQLAAILSL